MSLEHINILKVKVSAINIDLACQTINHWIKTRVKTYVCVVPVSTIIACQEDKGYLEIVNNAGMSTPDGVPLVWFGKINGNKIIKRTYGPDLMLALCELSEDTGYKHYFYGGSKEANQLLEARLKERFPKIKIVGRYAPPFKDGPIYEEDKVLDEINNANPDVLWIGLGSPKQDFWMRDHRTKLNVPVMLGVGAAFDFLSGTKKQAPEWMRCCGLEWFFRLCSEPRRLWKRYLVGNTRFIYLLFKDFLRRKIGVVKEE